jgi:protein-S-isoprenylcysteine O-methyltransferase Ste14
MDYDQKVSVGLFIVLLIIILGGTFSSPMPPSIKGMVGVGLLVFGILTFYIGIRHGEYRESH